MGRNAWIVGTINEVDVPIDHCRVVVIDDRHVTDIITPRNRSRCPQRSQDHGLYEPTIRDARQARVANEEPVKS